MKKHLFNLAGILALIVGYASVASGATLYKVQDLGTLPGDYESMPWGINAHGDVVGASTGPKGHRAFLYVDRVGMIELPAVARGANSVARDINDNGVVVGRSNFRAAVWDLSRNIGLDLRGHYLDRLASDSEAMAVNGRGDITGWIGGDLLRGSRHAFVYFAEGGLVDLTPFGNGEGNDINEAGQVAGVQLDRAFVWSGRESERPELIPLFGNSAAYGINAFTEVVGSIAGKQTESIHLFKFSASVGVQDLGGHGDVNLLRRINVEGLAVGQGRLSDGRLQALVHSDRDGLWPLNKLIESRGKWFVDFATDINDEGVIVASAWNTTSKVRHAVKLIPVTRVYCPDQCARVE